MRPSRIENQYRVGLAPPFFVAVGFYCIAFALVTLAGGCSVLPGRGGDKEQKPSFEQIVSSPYERTTIKESLSLDVQRELERSPEVFGPRFAGSELLSRSESVVAAIGQTKDSYRNWFNMGAFDELKSNAVRKYFFFVDDRNARLIIKSRRGLRFDCQMVLTD